MFCYISPQINIIATHILSDYRTFAALRRSAIDIKTSF